MCDLVFHVLEVYLVSNAFFFDSWFGLINLARQHWLWSLNNCVVVIITLSRDNSSVNYFYPLSIKRVFFRLVCVNLYFVYLGVHRAYPLRLLTWHNYSFGSPTLTLKACQSSKTPHSNQLSFLWSPCECNVASLSVVSGSGSAFD